jgi:hypothetical protein
MDSNRRPPSHHALRSASGETIPDVAGWGKGGALDAIQQDA